MKKLPNIIITELFLVKADWKRTFMGQIIKEKNSEGLYVIHGNVVVNEGKIWCCSTSVEEIGQALDDMCILKLDFNIHDYYGMSEIISGTSFFLN